MARIVVQTHALKQKLKHVFIPSALAVLLSACSGGDFFQSKSQSHILTEAAYSSSEFYINRADKAQNKSDQQTYRLLAVRQLIEENKLVEAQNTMAEISAELDSIQQLEYRLLQAQLSALQNQNNQALTLLKNLPKAQLSRAQMIRFHQTESRIAENQKDMIEAVRARGLMDRYLNDPKARQENNDKIWEMLRNANRAQLSTPTMINGDTVLAGWLALAGSYHQHLSSPSELARAIAQWQQQYPSHPAALQMPNELKNIGNYQQVQVSNLALLLPLSGDYQLYGDIIKSGFNDAKGSDQTAVKFFDTSAAPVSGLAAQAKAEGAQILVGPLLKDRVDSLLASGQHNGINTLVLNSTPNARAMAQVCYYGLSPEAEAHSAAERFQRDGLSHAIVVVPQSDYGHRVADAFARRWLTLTGLDADIRYYNQAADVQIALEQSPIVRGSGLYMPVSAEEVMEIKENINNSPLAGQFPIYASSRSHLASNGNDFNLVMEGVRFSEIPLLAEPDSAAYRRAEQIAEGDYATMRLYAMGFDAWALANKFNEFRQIPGYRINGLTGGLSAGTNCNIERAMAWLQYRNGAVQLAH